MTDQKNCCNGNNQTDDEPIKLNDVKINNDNSFDIEKSISVNLDDDSDDDILQNIYSDIKQPNHEMKTKTNKPIDPISILDKYKGVIWGCAIGDAIGLQFEGCDYRRANMLVQRGIKFPTTQTGDRIRGVIKGDWTDDTDHMVLLLDSSYFDNDNIMRIDNKLFASKLVTWKFHGFPELGDTAGMGIGALINKLISHPRFTIEPQIVSLEVYKMMGGDANTGKIDAPAPNGALMRIAPLALSEDYLNEILEHCIVTHYDGRCILTCLMQCEIIRYVIKTNSITENDIREFYSHSIKILDKSFIDETNIYFKIGMNGLIGKLNEYGLIGTTIFEELEVGQYGNKRDKNGYTLVAFSIMLWALRAAINGYNYETIIKTIIGAGGDADTNAAIAGAVLGAYFGYSALPKDWIASTPHRKWLDKKIMDFLNRTK